MYPLHEIMVYLQLTSESNSTDITFLIIEKKNGLTALIFFRVLNH